MKRALLGACAGWLAIDLYMSGVYAAFGSTPLRLFQWDASNVLGRAAYAGGWLSGALGLALDYAVSFVWAAVALFLVARIDAARKRPLAFGVLYGAMVMCVMIFGIVPLGHAQQASRNAESMLIVLVGHTAFFGVPLVAALTGGTRALALSAHRAKSG